MNRTGAYDSLWSCALKYIADINNICATPVLGWKTPISVQHGYTPDISAFLNYQCFQKIYFKFDEASPKSDEAPGYWLGVSDTVGDAMTFDIYSVKSGKVIQRSAIRPADPTLGGFTNNRVQFPEEEDEENLSLF